MKGSLHAKYPWVKHIHCNCLCMYMFVRRKTCTVTCCSALVYLTSLYLMTTGGDTMGISLCKTLFQLGIGLKKQQKQGGDERAQQEYPTSAKITQQMYM